MSYTSQSIALSSPAIAAAKQTLSALVQSKPLTGLSITSAIEWLDSQLPVLPDVVSLLTWANAMEQLCNELPEAEILWLQVLQTEGYSLRLRAQALPRDVDRR